MKSPETFPSIRGTARFIAFHHCWSASALRCHRGIRSHCGSARGPKLPWRYIRTNRKAVVVIEPRSLLMCEYSVHCDRGRLLGCNDGKSKARKYSGNICKLPLGVHRKFRVARSAHHRSLHILSK